MNKSRRKNTAARRRFVKLLSQIERNRKKIALAIYDTLPGK